MAPAARPRHDPHGETSVSASKPSSRGAPAWADDPDEVASELAAMDQRDAHRSATKKDRAHVQAHQEQARRNRTAKTTAARQGAAASRSASAAAAKAARDDAAAAQARSFGGRAKRTSSIAGGVRSVLPSGGGGVSDASGFVLALVGWCWIVLPFIVTPPGASAPGGITGVRDVWRAKFFNKGPNGEDLL